MKLPTFLSRNQWLRNPYQHHEGSAVSVLVVVDLEEGEVPDDIAVGPQRRSVDVDPDRVDAVVAQRDAAEDNIPRVHTVPVSSRRSG